MFKKLILHIGWNKTGSTSIQGCLKNNRDLLLKEGILVPKTGFSTKRMHHQFRVESGEKFEQLLEELKQEMLENNAHTAIISDEDINKIKNYKKYNIFNNVFENVYVIGFLRRQDLLMESFYNQMLKTPWKKELSIMSLNEAVARFKKLHWFHYDKVLDEFANIFGKENIKVQAFEPKLFKVPLEQKFFNLAEIFISDIKYSDEQLNKSTPYSSIPLLRSLNSYDMSILATNGPLKRSILKFINRHYSDDSKYIIDYETRKKIYAIYENGNSYVAKIYLNKEDGKLFNEDVPTLDTPIQTLNDFNNDSIIQEFFIPFIKEMNKN